MIFTHRVYRSVRALINVKFGLAQETIVHWLILVGAHGVHYIDLFSTIFHYDLIAFEMNSEGSTVQGTKRQPSRNGQR